MSKSDSHAVQTERLLRMRQGRLEKARSALTEASADAGQIQQRIDEALRAIAEHNAAAHRALADKASYADLGVYRRCVDDLQAVVATHREWMVEARRRVRLRRQELGGLLGELKAARAVRQRQDAQQDRRARDAETREDDDLHTARESTRRRREA